MRKLASCLWALLLLLQPPTMRGQNDDNDDVGGALDAVFVLASKARSVSGNMACRQSILDLMVRQTIPTNAEAIRTLSNTQLLSLAMLASVGGISTWKRDASDDYLFQLTDEGRLIHPYSPNAVETDVMLCIICALLIVIATLHMSAPRTKQN